MGGINGHDCGEGSSSGGGDGWIGSGSGSSTSCNGWSGSTTCDLRGDIDCRRQKIIKEKLLIGLLKSAAINSIIIKMSILSCHAFGWLRTMDSHRAMLTAQHIY